MATHSQPLQNEPTWPVVNGERVLFLIDASSAFEAKILEGWIARQRPEEGAAGFDVLLIPPSRKRSRHGSLEALEALEASLATGNDAMLTPLRIAWLPKRRNGKRAVHLSDILSFGDPRDPDPIRQRFIHATQIDRCRVVAGEPALTSELRARWQNASGAGMGQTKGFAEFVARQAALALERAERRLRGARYKVPRLLREDVLQNPSFRGGLALLARETQTTTVSVAREAAGYLREIAATHSPFVIDIVSALVRLLYTQGYDAALSYDRAQLERVKALGQQHPVVFLPSHKSNLDHLVLQYALHENGHAPNHTAGGINMNFFPVGPLVRRSGTFFIRRTFRDNAIYKFVLQHYIDYLIEKRFSLEWYTI